MNRIGRRALIGKRTEGYTVRQLRNKRSAAWLDVSKPFTTIVDRLDFLLLRWRLFGRAFAANPLISHMPFSHQSGKKRFCFNLFSGTLTPSVLVRIQVPQPTTHSKQPLGLKRRAMTRFRRMRSLQKFASVHSSIHNHFDQERHLYSKDDFKLNRAAALAEWHQPFAA